MRELDRLREEIHDIDLQLMELLEKRTGLVKQVGVYKMARGMEIYVPEVEEHKIAQLKKYCNCPGLVETIWPVIMCYERSVE